MRIEITAGGIYGAEGKEVPIGTVVTLKEEPKAWAGRYRVVSGGKDDGDKTSVTNPAETEAVNLEDMTVVELKKLAVEENIDLGDATLKADIIAAIQLAGEAQA